MATAFELISDTTLTSAAASIQAGVSTDYRRFRLTLYVVKDATDGAVSVRFNSDSGANYAWQEVKAVDTAVSGARSTAQAAITVNQAIDADDTGLYLVEVEKPLASTTGRCTATASLIDNAGTPAIEVFAVSGEWSNTSDLISSIAVLASAGNFAAGTRLLVEGAKP